MDITEAYRYRDWVVDAFNRDMPYDDFIKNQIAGDLMPGGEPGEINSAGTGYANNSASLDRTSTQAAYPTLTVSDVTAPALTIGDPATVTT